jgi:hypothetical protein
MQTTIREDHRVKVTQHNGRIIKEFKPNYKFKNPDHQLWMHTLNGFSDRHGHFPRIFEANEDTLITAIAPGHALHNGHIWVQQDTLEKKIRLLQRLQVTYFQFITNVLRHNITYGTHIAHHDLNSSNMFFDDDRMTCIDLNSVTTHLPCEYYWIEYGAKEIGKRSAMLGRGRYNSTHR